MARDYRTATVTSFPILTRPSIPIPRATIHKFRIHAAFPSQRIVIRRKNYLRPKILKTLIKPLQEERNDFLLNEPASEVLISEPVLDALHEIQSETEEFRVSETVIGEKGIFGRFSSISVLKAGGWIIATYMFTAFMVWVFSYDDESSKSSGFIMNGDSTGLAFFNEKEREERVSEIRAMARKVRDMEKRGRIEGSFGDEGSEIEKEIGERLVKLEKRLSSKRENVLPDNFMNYLGFFGNQGDDNGDGNGDYDNDDEDDGGSGADDYDNDNEKILMFKKKFRFRGPSLTDSRSSPKGFSSTKPETGLRDNRSLSSVNGSDLNGKSRERDLWSSNSGRKDKHTQVDSMQINEKKDLQKQMESGDAQKIGEGRTSSEVPKMSKSLDKNLNGSAKEINKPGLSFDGATPTSSRRHDGSGPGKRSVSAKTVDKQSAVQKNVWWLKLPYVLAILMRRGSDHEGCGFYSLNTLSQTGGQEDYYAIAFEDRGDANNFCHLLDCYFEDLGDFSADIVPLSVKELYEKVQSGLKKVIVVKKRQLKLYAGQPFAEVEEALRSLIEQDQDRSRGS